MNFDWSRCATVPRQHQKDGVEALLKCPAFMLADEVGAGKSKQVIDAAQILYEQRLLDAVVVLCPAFARGVWANPDPALGEIAKHGWRDVPNHVVEFSVNHPKLFRYPHPMPKDGLIWIVSNFEYVRREEHLDHLLKSVLHSKRFWLICDESWAIKDCKTASWKAANAIRKLTTRVTLLNGTPVADSPLDLFAQMKLLSPDILGIKYFSHFRARYAILKPNVSFPLIVGWQNLEELREKVAPYVLRRHTRDCFDLPPILEPVLVEARLTEETWKIYKQMRDEMVAWLSTAEASVAQQAIVKGLRLSQITSGFLGGVENITDPECPDFGQLKVHFGPHEIGREKLDALLAWLKELRPQPERILVWCRFRAEVERTAKVLADETVPTRDTFKLYGQQPREEREAAIRALNPEIPIARPVAVVGNPLAGGAALNLAGASLAVSLSHDFNLRVYLQARGRIDRPGQRNNICYVDIVAVGPKGQMTIDSHVLAALRKKEDIAAWTASTWRKKLLDE